MNARSSNVSLTGTAEGTTVETIEEGAPGTVVEATHERQAESDLQTGPVVKNEDQAGVRKVLRAITPEEPPRERPAAELEGRLQRLERQNRWMKLALVLIMVLFGFLFLDRLPPDAIVKQTLMESKELKLVDNDGTPRLFLRMYSRVPVLQILDRNGKPRISLGLRFDDTPFLDLSDQRGDTRVSLEITADDKPKLELFDQNGETSFKIQ